ncbi:hypothetical protein HJC23_006073 [Cyclotella cryptica]|uniref:Uncharacterized protein n=1 Tax=Cyclotella cryptica TaxID=29204 RepID=A0ABD3QL18_9STRA|eukprot:CCRYP_004533-RA/>CCRYP_004533-RA protein AED:0.22 eAED:0.22 QI:246/1/1/1/0.5/0.4/5/1826/438
MKFSTSLTLILGGLCQVVSSTSAQNFREHCAIWPMGWPTHHHDTSCDRHAQNTKLQAEIGSYPSSISFYLNIPEERTWVCPLENDVSDAVDPGGLHIGRPAKWIVYNRASTPIIISHASGSPFATGGYEPSSGQMKSAVYPNGPVVLPGGMAVVNGYQGQLFEAREYKEDYNLMFFPYDNEYVNSYKKAIPPTWSHATKGTRYSNMKSNVIHVLGSPGRVLMKHRMGMIHIKNEFGSICPEMFGRGLSTVDTNRTKPINPDPECNFVSQGFINKVGCPIDLYFAPPKTDPESSFNCEVYSDHMGAFETFIKSGQTNINSFDTPIIHQNTYTTHSFVARMSHDQSLVARIEIDHDTVYDCPELRRDVEAKEEERLLQSIPAMILSSSNATQYEYSPAKLSSEKDSRAISKGDLYTSFAYNLTAKSINSGVLSGIMQHAT